MTDPYGRHKAPEPAPKLSKGVVFPDGHPVRMGHRAIITYRPFLRLRLRTVTVYRGRVGWHWPDGTHVWQEGPRSMARAEECRLDTLAALGLPDPRKASR